MPTTVKLAQPEIDLLRKIEQDALTLVFDLGKLHVELKSIENVKADIQNRIEQTYKSLSEADTKSQTVLSNLKSKYPGLVEVNTETGEIITESVAR